MTSDIKVSLCATENKWFMKIMCFIHWFYMVLILAPRMLIQCLERKLDFERDNNFYIYM